MDYNCHSEQYDVWLETWHQKNIYIKCFIIQTFFNHLQAKFPFDWLCEFQVSRVEIEQFENESKSELQ